MSDETRQKAKWARWYALGTEFAAAVAGFALLGYWLDNHFETKPKATLICSAIGLVGGSYNLVRSSIRQFRESSAEDAARAEDAVKSGDRPNEGPKE